MEGLYEILPGSVPVEIAGQTWRLGPWTLADDAEVERRVLSRRRRPLDVAREAIQGQPESLQRHILGLAFAEECRGPRATREEVCEWLDSREGRLFEFWLRTRKNHRALTMERVEQLFAAHAAEIVQANREVTVQTGERPLGNASAPEKPGPPLSAEPSPGEPSSGDSLQPESLPEKSAA